MKKKCNECAAMRCFKAEKRLKSAPRMETAAEYLKRKLGNKYYDKI